MIARLHRFHGHNAVARVRGRSVRADDLTFYYAKNPKRSTYRLAVIVSRKVSKSAVVRNRIRRRIFEVVRKSAVLDDTAVDVVCVVHKDSVSSVPSQKLEQGILQACKKISSTTSSL